jgi:hypothetical protein
MGCKDVGWLRLPQIGTRGGGAVVYMVTNFAVAWKTCIFLTS